MSDYDDYNFKKPDRYIDYRLKIVIIASLFLFFLYVLFQIILIHNFTAYQ